MKWGDMLKPFKKIIWTVDPFQRDDEGLRNVTRLVAGVARQFNAKVEVAYAVGHPKLYLEYPKQRRSEALFYQQVKNGIDRDAALLKDLAPGVRITTRIVTSRHPRKGTRPAGLLAAHAHRTGAGLIVVATHARGPLVKWLLGSFAESLLAAATVPLLIVNPRLQYESGRPLKRLLFPTDLSAASRRHFDQLLVLARRHGMNITALHALTNEYIPAMVADSFLYGAAQVGAELYRELLRRQGGELKRWVAAAQAAGVDCKARLPKGPGLVSEVIRCAAARHDAVVMSVHRKIGAFDLIGSVTKKVARKSPVPVLVLRG